ncbi:isochorismatase family protein [Synechococcales cyanobacterium C]|uniref:Isochorismatase family protein n=1 Tax=Petrachloros mirabilis ULC683 TaxID=2781853 RepID=A0A8K2A950_9CYAN|nr:isochorismatase family cysteine hydrolase [Petrachloros mirabilis]NCJ08734.1 isochorismatase family protein [Petrachloros mirabilis ULC683]
MVLISAQPYDYPVTDNSHCALLIIDMQRDFLEPGGFGDILGNDVSQLRVMVPTLKRLLELFRGKQWPVIHTLECHRPDLSDCPQSKYNRSRGELGIGDVGPMGRILIAGELGNAIIPELAPIAGEVVIEKPGKGAFCNTNLESILRQSNITHLLIAGVTTEVCVQTTMREANDRGFECLLIEDATESYFPEFKQATLEMVRAQGGIVGWTGSSADIIAAMSAHSSPQPVVNIGCE